MTQECRPAKCIEAIRVAKLDQCTFAPVEGPLNAYAMGCIIDPAWSEEVEEGVESQVLDNCNDVCLYDEGCDKTKRYNVEFKIKVPDKEFLSLITGAPLIVDAGVSIGLRNVSRQCSPYVWLEMFERTDGCDGLGVPIYFHHVFPAIRLRESPSEREGIFRIPSIEGKTREVPTNSIGNGPFNDFPAAYAAAAPATERTHYVWFEDDFVPAIQCGSIAVPAQV